MNFYFEFQLFAFLLLMGSTFALPTEDRNSMWAHADETSKMRLASGNILMKTGKIDLALKLFQDAVQYNPINSECWSSLADVQSQLGHFNDAKDSLRRSIALLPINKPLSNKIIKLQDIIHNPISKNISCEYDIFLNNKIKSIIKELKKKRKFSKENKEFAKLIRSAYLELSESLLE